MKKVYTSAFKAQVVQELLRETKTLAQLATEQSVHPNVRRDWRTTALSGLPSLFEKPDSVAALRARYEQQAEDLYAQIGRLTTHVAWLKKNLALTLTSVERAALVEREARLLSRTEQAELLTLRRRSRYDQALPPSAEAVQTKHAIDRISTAQPSYGSRRIAGLLARDYQLAVQRKAVPRHMRAMGMRGLSPGPHLSRRHPEHRVYPYRLRNVARTHSHQAWAIDSTSIPVVGSWRYVVAVLDISTRSIVRWTEGDTLKLPCVLDTVTQALAQATPKIGNSDQGSHVTSPPYTQLLEQAGVPISMDGKGRALDNIFIERLWRTVTYEDVYVRDYRSPRDVRTGLKAYLKHDNEQRPHSALGYRTPAEVSFGSEQTGERLPLSKS